MLSAVIASEHSYPAMPLAGQPEHQRFVHSGPLVLGAAPLKPPTPTTDRDRTVSRRSEPSSRTTLNGEQPYPWDRLQPQDVMSRHRGAKPPRRYELLGEISLLSPAYLCTPPLLFGRTPPQSNCLPCTVPGPDDEPRLEPQTSQAGISTTTPRWLAPPLQSLPAILHRPVHSPMQSYSKGVRGLSV